jgi:hypothetical protein
MPLPVVLNAEGDCCAECEDGSVASELANISCLDVHNAINAACISVQWLDESQVESGCSSACGSITEIHNCSIPGRPSRTWRIESTVAVLAFVSSVVLCSIFCMSRDMSRRRRRKTLAVAEAYQILQTMPIDPKEESRSKRKQAYGTMEAKDGQESMVVDVSEMPTATAESTGDAYLEL